MWGIVSKDIVLILSAYAECIKYQTKEIKKAASIKTYKLGTNAFSRPMNDQCFIPQDSNLKLINIDDYLLPSDDNHSIIAKSRTSFYILGNDQKILEVLLSKTYGTRADRFKSLDMKLCNIANNTTNFISASDSCLIYGNSKSLVICQTRPFVINAKPPYYSNSCPKICAPVTSDGIYFYSLTSQTEINVYSIKALEITRINSITLRLRFDSVLLPPFQKYVVPKEWMKDASIATNGKVIQFVYISKFGDGLFSHFVRCFSLVDGTHIKDYEVIKTFPIHSWIFNEKTLWFLSPCQSGASIFKSMYYSSYIPANCCIATKPVPDFLYTYLGVSLKIFDLPKYFNSVLTYYIEPLAGMHPLNPTLLPFIQDLIMAPKQLKYFIDYINMVPLDNDLYLPLLLTCLIIIEQNIFIIGKSFPDEEKQGLLLMFERISTKGVTFLNAYYYLFEFYNNLFEIFYQIDPNLNAMILNTLYPNIPPYYYYLITNTHSANISFCYIFNCDTIESIYSPILREIASNKYSDEEYQFVINYQNAVFSHFAHENKENGINESIFNIVKHLIAASFISYKYYLNIIPFDPKDSFIINSMFVDIFKRFLLLTIPLQSHPDLSYIFVKSSNEAIEATSSKIKENIFCLNEFSRMYEILLEIFDFWLNCIISIFKGSGSVSLIKKYIYILKTAKIVLNDKSWSAVRLTPLETFVSAHFEPDFDIHLVMEFIYKKIQNPFNRRLSPEEKQFEIALMVGFINQLHLNQSVKSLYDAIKNQKGEIVIPPQVRQVVTIIYRIRGDLRSSKQATVQYNEKAEHEKPPTLQQQYEKYKELIKDKSYFLLSFNTQNDIPEDYSKILTDFILSDISVVDLFQLIDSLGKYMTNITSSLKSLEDFLRNKENPNLVYSLCSILANNSLIYDSFSLITQFVKDNNDLFSILQKLFDLLLEQIEFVPGNAVIALETQIVLCLAMFRSDLVPSCIVKLFQTINKHAGKMNIESYKSFLTYIFYLHRILLDNNVIKYDQTTNEIIGEELKNIPKEVQCNFMIAHSVMHGKFTIDRTQEDLTYLKVIDETEIHAYTHFLSEISDDCKYIDSYVPYILQIIGSIFTGCSSEILHLHPLVSKVYLTNNPDFCRTPSAQINCALELIDYLRKLLVNNERTREKTINIFETVLNRNDYNNENTVKMLIAIFSVVSNIIDTYRPCTLIRDPVENRLYYVASVNEDMNHFMGITLPITSVISGQIVQVADYFKPTSLIAFTPSMFKSSNVLITALKKIIINKSRDCYSDCLLSFFAECCLDAYLVDAEVGQSFSNSFISSIQSIPIRKFVFRKHSSLVMSLLSKSLINPTKGIFIGSPLQPQFYHASFTDVVNTDDYELSDHHFRTRNGTHVFVTSVIDDKYPNYLVIKLRANMRVHVGVLNHAIDQTQIKSVSYSTVDKKITLNSKYCQRFVPTNDTFEIRFHPQKCKVSFSVASTRKRILSVRLPSTLCSFFAIVDANEYVEYKCSLEASTETFRKSVRVTDIFRPRKFIKHFMYREAKPTDTEMNSKKFKMLDVTKAPEREPSAEQDSYITVKYAVVDASRLEYIVEPQPIEDKDLAVYKSIRLISTITAIPASTTVGLVSSNPRILSVPSPHNFYYEVSNICGSLKLVKAAQANMRPLIQIPPLHFTNFEHMPAEILNCYFSGVCNNHREEVLTLLFIRNIKNEQSLKYFALDTKQVLKFVTNVLLILEPIKLSNLRESRSPINFDINVLSENYTCTKSSLFDYQSALNNIISIMTQTPTKCNEFIRIWFNYLVKMFRNEYYHTVTAKNTSATIMSYKPGRESNVIRDPKASGWITFVAEFGKRNDPLIVFDPIFPQKKSPTEGYCCVIGDTITLRINFTSEDLVQVVIPIYEDSNTNLLDTFFELVINFKYFVLFLEAHKEVVNKSFLPTIKTQIRECVYMAIGSYSPFFISHDGIILRFLNQHMPMLGNDFTKQYIEVLNIFINLTQNMKKTSINEFIQEQKNLFDDIKSYQFRMFITEEESTEMLPELPQRLIPEKLVKSDSLCSSLMSLKRILIPPKQLEEFPIHLIITDWCLSYLEYPPVEITIINENELSVFFTHFIPEKFILNDADVSENLLLYYSQTSTFESSSKTNLFNFTYSENCNKLYIRFPKGIDITNHHFVVTSSPLFKGNINKFVYEHRKQLISDLKEMKDHWSKKEDQKILSHINPKDLDQANVNSSFTPNILAVLETTHREHLINLRSKILISFNWLCFKYKEITEGESFTAFKRFISMTMSVESFKRLIVYRSDYSDSLPYLEISRRDGMDVRSGVSKNLNKSMICQYSKFYNSTPEKFRNYERPFHIYFTGENGVDCGGLMREFATELAKDIAEPRCGLFIKTPNGRENKGSYRNCLIPSPSDGISKPNNVYRAIGGLIASAIRANMAQPFSFPPLFWDYLAGGVITPNHIFEIDETYRQLISDITDALNSGMTEENFKQTFNLRPVVIDSRGKEISILSRNFGKITLNNCGRYISLCHEARIRELERPLEHIKFGFWDNLRTGIPNYVTPDLLEYLACGDIIVDINRLKLVTCLTIPKGMVPMFWNVVSRMSDDQRRKLLQFWTGSMSISSDPSVTYAVDYIRSPPDTRLPTASTCFFKLHVPLYSSAEKMYQKFIIAIENSGSFENS